jgi:hypothetical protein
MGIFGVATRRGDISCIVASEFNDTEWYNKQYQVYILECPHCMIIQWNMEYEEAYLIMSHHLGPRIILDRASSWTAHHLAPRIILHRASHACASKIAVWEHVSRTRNGVEPSSRSTRIVTSTAAMMP